MVEFIDSQEIDRKINESFKEVVISSDSIRHDESEDFDVDKAQEETKKKRGQSTSTAGPSSSKTAASAEYSAWTTTNTRIKHSITTIPDDLYMDDETTADEQAYS
ncbi:hypothetical protein Tco_0147301, partial [Tanacetum coccineum]